MAVRMLLECVYNVITKQSQQPSAHQTQQVTEQLLCMTGAETWTVFLVQAYVVSDTMLLWQWRCSIFINVAYGWY